MPTNTQDRDGPPERLRWSASPGATSLSLAALFTAPFVALRSPDLEKGGDCILYQLPRVPYLVLDEVPLVYYASVSASTIRSNEFDEILKPE
ncbi:hypothetical protein ACRALDRAFT_206640 [Sodiomyces alcalophilus JCM 7366]|uniref:uncharacterized protein n=1 Tax=Sodiomyces alcalophilus JCM 7366 TaxID=591952 RepID=UPI0039B3873D